MNFRSIWALVSVVFITTPILAAEVTTDGGLKVTSDDGESTFQLGGRLHLDAAFYDEDSSEIDNDTEVRRARILLKGVIEKDWEYKINFDFAGGDTESKDVFIKHKPSGITIGHQKAPFSLEEMGSSNDMPFIERGMLNSLVTSRRLGVTWATPTPAGYFTIGAYDHSTDGGEEDSGASARLTKGFKMSDDALLHLGAAVAVEGPGDEAADTLRIRARPESHLATRLIDTGTISDVDDVRKLGLEAAYVNGPLTVQSEYVQSEVSRDGGLEDLTFSGYYLYGAWVINGSTRPYSAGEGKFKRIKPTGDSGAWEVGVRYSHLDLNDSDITGGDEDNITLGLNYYVNKNLRFMGNLIFADSERNGVPDDPTIFQVRAQLTF